MNFDMRRRLAAEALGTFFLVMAVAAAEAAVGLAIIVVIHRSRESINVDDVNLMKW